MKKISKVTLTSIILLTAACDDGADSEEGAPPATVDSEISSGVETGYSQITPITDDFPGTAEKSRSARVKQEFPSVAKIPAIPGVKAVGIDRTREFEKDTLECGRRLKPAQGFAKFSGRSKLEKGKPAKFGVADSLEIDFHVAQSLERGESQLVVQLADGLGGTMDFAAHHWTAGEMKNSRVKIPFSWIDKHMTTDQTTVSFYITGLRSRSHGQVILTKTSDGVIEARSPSDFIELEAKMPLSDAVDRESSSSTSGYSSVGILPCFAHHVIYNDANSGDIWTQTGWHYKNAKHQWVQKYHNGNFVGSDWLNNSGCLSAPIYHGPGNYRFKFWSGARLHGIPNTAGGAPTVNVVDHGTNYFSVFTTETYVGSGAATQVLYLGNSHQVNALLAAVQSIEQQGGMMGTATTTVHTDTPTGGSYHSQGNVFLASPAEASKYTIAHEMGHAFAYRTVAGRKLNGGDCSYNSVSCPDHSNGPGHALDSKEHSQCSIQEGFAVFWGAAAYNYAFQYDCEYEGFDCEGDADFPTRKLETDCNTPWGGMGTDIDWARLFWDIRSSDSPVSIPEMVNWFSLASSWGRNNGYQRLNTAANSIGGNLDSQWDIFKGINGVDH